MKPNKIYIGAQRQCVLFSTPFFLFSRCSWLAAAGGGGGGGFFFGCDSILYTHAIYIYSRGPFFSFLSRQLQHTSGTESSRNVINTTDGGEGRADSLSLCSIDGRRCYEETKNWALSTCTADIPLQYSIHTHVYRIVGFLYAIATPPPSQSQPTRSGTSNLSHTQRSTQALENVCVSTCPGRELLKQQ